MFTVNCAFFPPTSAVNMGSRHTRHTHTPVRLFFCPGRTATPPTGAVLGEERRFVEIGALKKVSRRRSIWASTGGTWLFSLLSIISRILILIPSCSGLCPDAAVINGNKAKHQLRTISALVHRLDSL